MFADIPPGCELFCWFAILAVIGASRSSGSVFHFWILLFDSSSFCEEECGRNERQISPGNRNCTPATWVMVPSLLCKSSLCQFHFFHHHMLQITLADHRVIIDWDRCFLYRVELLNIPDYYIKKLLCSIFVDRICSNINPLSF